MKLDLTTVAPADLPRVKELLKKVGTHQKYSAHLQTALDRMYDWQKKAIAYTKDHKVIGILAGNQIGKSEATMAVVAVHLTGEYPDWWQGKKFTKPVRIMVAGVDTSHNKNVLQERLLGSNNWRMKDERGSGMIPLDAILVNSAVTQRGDDIASIKIKHKTGGMSELLFRAYSMGREAAQGFQADLIVIDEQPKDDFWAEALTRTRATRGHVICSFTPLKGATTLVEELMALPGSEDSPEDRFGDKYKTDGKWASVRASWHDADHIPDSDIEDAKRDYSYDYDARVYGMPVAGFGRVFPFTVQDIAYDSGGMFIPDSWPHLIGIDLGIRDPSVVCQAAWDEEKDIIYITHCEMKETNTTRDITRMIAGQNHTLPVAWPPDAGKTSLSASSNVAEQLREQGVNLLPKPFLNPRGADGKRNNYKSVGVNHMNDRFHEGKLKIADTCSDLLYQFEQYSYTEGGKLQDGKDDCIDAMRYTVMSIVQGYGRSATETFAFEGVDDTEEYNFY